LYTKPRFWARKKKCFDIGYIDDAAINERASGLFFTYGSTAWIEEHGAASPEYEWRHCLHWGHSEGRKLHDNGTGCGVNIGLYK